ncbi:MAG: MATE family efflux transporter, partial [Chloroflexota bacterium]
AWPAVLEQLLNMSVGLADTYIVGHLGASQLAAVGLSIQATSIVWSLISAIGVGSTAIVARRVGEGAHRKANEAAQQSIILALVVGIIMAILLWTFAPLFLNALGAETEVVEMGTAYLRAVSSTVFMMSILFVGSAILRGSGDTRTPMLIMLVINVINIIVAYTLTMGVGPLPALGVLGSGIGAATARGLGGIIMLVVLIRGTRVVKLSLSGWRIVWSTVRRILQIGLPTAGEQLLMRFGQIILAGIITGLGTLQYAAHQVAINALSVAYMPGFGFALAATALVGQELGARRIDLAKRSAYEAVKMVAIIMTAMGVLVSISARSVMGIFVQYADVIEIGTSVLRIAGLAMPALGISFTFAGALRGAGDTTAVLYITGSSIWIVRVANAIWLGSLFGLRGVWFAVAADFVVRAIALAVRFRRGRWQQVKI